MIENRTRKYAFLNHEKKKKKKADELISQVFVFLEGKGTNK